MALLAVEGTYKDGKIELDEIPEGVAESRVMVVFLADGINVQKPVPGDGLERESLRLAAFEQMKKGINLGGPPYPRREELYDRFNR